MLITEGIKDRFWSKIEIKGPEECWLWKLSTDTVGYGQVRIEGQIYQAHRLAFYFEHKIWPEVVRHRCDNRRCINPVHLEPGTQLDNIQDMKNRGRASRRPGSENPAALLNEEQVREIRRAKRKPGLYKELATKFGVSTGAINDVRQGRSWRHIS